MKAKSDYLFLSVLGLLIVNTVTQHFLNRYVLSLNNYFGFIAWGTAFILHLGRSKYRRLALGWLLILGTLNLLTFTIGKIAVSVGPISESGTEHLGINPIILVILIVYYFVNRTPINRILSRTLIGTEEEQKQKRNKQIEFYFEKFSKCEPEEFEELLQRFDDYPVEAQVALKRITAMRKNNGKPQ